MADSADTPEIDRPIVLVGLMGAGKTSVGRRLARRLGLEFVDADTEIERAAGLTIPDIFEAYGESAFRDCEKRVIARLLDGPPRVIATGGGAFVDDDNRALIKEKGVSVWLRAAIPLLVERVSRRNNRPLLQNTDPAAVLQKLAAERDPYYAEADITVESGDGPHETVVAAILNALRDLMPQRPERSPQ
jgi:shikimate kinase